LDCGRRRAGTIVSCGPRKGSQTRPVIAGRSSAECREAGNVPQMPVARNSRPGIVDRGMTIESGQPQSARSQSGQGRISIDLQDLQTGFQRTTHQSEARGPAAALGSCMAWSMCALEIETAALRVSAHREQNGAKPTRRPRMTCRAERALLRPRSNRL